MPVWIGLDCTCEVLACNHEFWIQDVGKRKYSASSLDFWNHRKIISAFTINLRKWKWKAPPESYKVGAGKSTGTTLLLCVMPQPRSPVGSKRGQQDMACDRQGEQAGSAALCCTELCYTAVVHQIKTRRTTRQFKAENPTFSLSKTGRLFHN